MDKGKDRPANDPHDTVDCVHSACRDEGVIAVPPDSGPLEVGSHEDRERAERLRNDLRHIQERWNNRLILEHRSLWEAYLDGRLEILLYGDWGGGIDDAVWSVRINIGGHVADNLASNSSVDVLDLHDSDGRNEVVVFVEVAESRDGPQIEVRVPARLYLFQNKSRKVGEGLLYRRVVGGGFQILPFLRKGEVDFTTLCDTAYSSVCPVIQSLPKIIDGVSNDRGKVLWNWLFGPQGQVKTIRLSHDHRGADRHIDDLVQILGQRGRISDQRINVAVGPFDL